MKQAVLKLGGSVLRGPEDASAILDILDSYADPLVVVVSAFKGVTDALTAAAGGAEGARSAGALACELRRGHRAFAEALGAPTAALEAASLRVDRLLCRLLALLDSADPRNRPEILGMGERLSATCIALALAALGRPAPIVEPGELGLVVSEGSSGPFVDLGEAGPKIRAALEGRRDAVVPGFYGVDEEGRAVLLGRGGSDYSAALVAAALGARSCDLVKDVAGFLTADPGIVAEARPVFDLSYEEAEALAIGGAKVLHSSSIRPLRAAGVPMRIIGRHDLGGGSTRIGPGGFSLEGPRALALATCVSGAARITVACRGWAAKSAARVISALESRGIATRGFTMGPEAVSFSVLVDGCRGEEGLKVAHEALFGRVARRESATFTGTGFERPALARKPGVA
jgi:aspartate kinase/aspartokinase/homoserine dehydrogenase 1